MAEQIKASGAQGDSLFDCWCSYNENPTSRVALGCRDLPPSAVSGFGVYSGDLNSGFHVSVTGSLSTGSSPNTPSPVFLGWGE